MLRAIIIDDMDVVRKQNYKMINTHCPQVAIIAEANSVATGIEAIKKNIPDLVFLDVEMPDGTGFDLLKKLPSIDFKIIFVSGYEGFAIKAFKTSAIDYLLKPIDAKELIEAVKKAEQAIDKDLVNLKLNTLFLNLERPKNSQKIILKTNDKIFSVNVQDIVRCQGDLNYTTFYFLDGTKIMVSKVLKDYEDILTDMGFFRTHQSHLINMSYFDYLNKTEGNEITMKDNTVVPLSKRKKVEFMTFLETI